LISNFILKDRYKNVNDIRKAKAIVHWRSAEINFCNKSNSK